MFWLGLCMAIAVPVGLACWRAQADDQAGDTAAASAGPDDIAASPPPGMTGVAIPQPVNPPADPQLAARIKRGEYLATAGDCMSCHTIPGGVPYAGGQPLQTPFGAMFSPNITPDKTYGIGQWTDAQFYNALHNGIGVGHSLLIFPRYLYPTMPWQDYNKLSYSDVMALNAYLQSLAPSTQKNLPSQIGFPFTLRAGLLLWRLVFFDNQPIQYAPSWSPQVRHGAYLVQALAHCAECHSQRNLLMAMEPSRYLAGGHIPAQSWYAPNISSAKTDGVGAWSNSDLVNFLYRGGALGTGAPYGPMQQVVNDSLSRLPASDVQDIAAYLQTATPARNTTSPAATAPAGAGAQLYVENCARCHGANGEGVANNFPNLAGNQSIWNGPADDLISMILGGFEPWRDGQSAMPAFGPSLSDDEIADLANYLRTAWGNKGAADATGAQVASERGLASLFTTLDTATAQVSLRGGGLSENFDEISGQLELFGGRENCLLKAAFASSDASASVKSVTLAGICTSQGAGFQGRIGIDGKTYTADFSLAQVYAGGAPMFILIGTPRGTAQSFAARIVLAKPAA